MAVVCLIVVGKVTTQPVSRYKQLREKRIGLRCRGNLLVCTVYVMRILSLQS